MNCKKVWLTGANGLLGTAIKEIASKEYPHLTLLPTTREMLDYADGEDVYSFIEEEQPDLMVNCIAFTNVDGAESQYQEALHANASIPFALATSLGKVPLIHVSTDHIFGGNGDLRREPYRESDAPMPANRYALSKLIGEQGLRWHKANSYILRTAWLYGPESWPNKSFYKSIRRNALQGNPLKVVTDEVSTPTSIFTLARVILSIADAWGGEGQLPYGTYHVTDLGEASRHTFAEAIVALSPETRKMSVARCLQSDLSLPAHRPHYSKLATTKIEGYLPHLMRDWRETLQEIHNYDNQE